MCIILLTMTQNLHNKSPDCKSYPLRERIMPTICYKIREALYVEYGPITRPRLI